jgi:hypothetical protein
MTNLELITCDLCQRRYNINVYQRHRNENQCIKRNYHRLPFESIKQRSIQIGDQIYSVQQQSKHKTEDVNNREKRKQQISAKQYQEKLPKISPSNNHRRTLEQEQAKQLLERRTKYQPPWIQKRSNFTKDHLNPIVIQKKHSSQKIVDRGISPKKLPSRERPPPPTTKFKNDDLPIKSNRQQLFSKNKKIPFSVSDRRGHNHTVSQQPILTHSPKHQPISTSKTPPYQTNHVDQTYSREQTNSASRPARKANTWTRSSKQSTNRDGISPIQIPTFCDSSSGPSHDRIILPSNQNYDDDDEFERYSPTPPSTPKYQLEKNKLPNFILNKQQTIIRPNTYQKSKRSHRQQYEGKSDYISKSSPIMFFQS